MKFVTWNVNGLRAARKKGFDAFFHHIDADIFAIQETKMQENQKDFSFDGYYEYWNDADKKGYSGTLIYTKLKPNHVSYGIDEKHYNDEGRIITLTFDDFYFVTAYVPNAQEALKRLTYRLQFEAKMRTYLNKLNQVKPVVYCGDLNVAHKEIDLKNPANNRKNAGFSDEERSAFSLLLDTGFTDIFRFKYPKKVKYTWWTYRFNARKRNAGWRIDYFLISDDSLDKVIDIDILNDVYGSDHCPVTLKIDL